LALIENADGLILVKRRDSEAGNGKDADWLVMVESGESSDDAEKAWTPDDALNVDRYSFNFGRL
jgi:hypothetical protein